MLTPRLLPRCYIPIKLVDFLPRERQKLEKEVRVPLQKGKGIGLEFTESQEIYSAF